MAKKNKSETQQLIAALRSAASALKHGRHSTASKKIDFIFSQTEPRATLRASLEAMAKGNAANPGPLEKIVQKTRGILDHCQMCGADGNHHLEPAFNPRGAANVLCLSCRIGSAEILEVKRGEMLDLVQLVAAGNTEFDDLEAEASKILTSSTVVMRAKNAAGKQITPHVAVQNSIELFRDSKMWYEKYSGPHAFDVVRRFATDTIETAYTADVSPDKVAATAIRLHSGSLVSVDPAPRNAGGKQITPQVAQIQITLALANFVDHPALRDAAELEAYLDSAVTEDGTRI